MNARKYGFIETVRAIFRFIFDFISCLDLSIAEKELKIIEEETKNK